MAGGTAAASVSLDLLEDLAREAGDIALQYFRQDPETWTKGDDSPVSEADLAVDAYLRRALLANYPGFGWISEESAAGPVRETEVPVFVVDPIDGTRAYLKGASEWSVSIALVQKGRPVAGLLYCPALDELYRAEAGSGAELNGETLGIGSPESLFRAKAAGPRTILGDQVFFDLELDVQPGGASLAYRLARVADGRLDVAIARSNSHDWDLAAADLLVHEAGGSLTGTDGETVVYNEPTLSHPVLVCSPLSTHDEMCDRVSAVLA